MKIDKEGNNMSNQQQQQIKRDKSADVSKDRAKQEKKEKERLEKERKEREKKEKERLEKERKEREKSMKKSASNLNQPQITNSATASDLNRDFSAGQQSGGGGGIPTSKSENVLSIFKKSGGGKSDSKAKKPEEIPKGFFRCQVVYLDETVKSFELEKNAIGEDLMTKVCEDLELIEKEYFSLTYRDVNNMKFWLDHEKKIKTQLKGNIGTMEPVFSFEVKFYPPEPNVLQEEITRYLLTLQLRHDIMDGKLPCTFVTHALLGSYTAQAELGDYEDATQGMTNSQQNINGLSGFDYLEGFCFAPNQTPELLAAIAEFHKDHK
jgi:erythrocyte membrane protein band 4.1